MADGSYATEKVKATINKHLKQVRKAGPNNIVALCPFHDDSSPSFAMNVHNGLYICYACGEKGSFRTFLTKLGMTPEQIRHHYGKTLEELKRNAPPPPDPSKPGVVVEENRHIPEDLLGLFHKCPEALLEEGFEEATLRDFGVGFDDKHNRITYPLRDLKGNLVGISGRAMNEDASSRYKVYKEEYKTWELPPYETDKSLLLWNAHRVYPEALKPGRPQPLVIVEGFKGCMWVAQAGYTNVVALMTKTMSWAQSWILKRMGGPFILFLDNDDAGIDGTIAVSKELIKISPDVRIVEYEFPQPTDVPIEEVYGLVQVATPYDTLLLS